ncbi:MAG: arsenate reductase ArsC [candidate division Zixibacteria bacterium]|nr:arsenate reductase ArsC [candidate division Zixibacteria bacterium]
MNILFICAGNSVRSQMAEGWARELCDEQHEVTSAGLQAGGVHPLAVESMRLVGIDISQHNSRRISDKLFNWADFIITVADRVEPYSVYFPETIKHIHWPIPNPDAMYAPNLQIEEAYAIIREDLRERVEQFLQSI